MSGKSKCLFNLYSEAILNELKTLSGFIIGGRNLHSIRYADDTVLMAESERKLQDYPVVAESETND